MTTCHNCGQPVPISEGIQTEETNRLCKSCASSTDWEQYIDTKCVGCGKRAVPIPEATYISYYGYACPECMEEHKWQYRRDHPESNKYSPLKQGEHAVEKYK
jgi:hypothetical protein